MHFIPIFAVGTAWLNLAPQRGDGKDRDERLIKVDFDLAYYYHLAMHSPTEIFLIDFHKKNPGCTPAAFANGTRIDGSSSYDAISCLLQPFENLGTVVDLACGNGALLKNIIDRKFQPTQLIGIDMSVGELESAASRLLQYPIKLIEGRAQGLPFADSAVDFIFCHMALMLMENIDQVAREITRCLKPAGLFSAVVGGKFERSEIYDRFLRLLDEALKEENRKCLSKLGDSRTKSSEGLKSLFNENDFEGVEVSEFQLHFYERPESLMNFFMLMYDVGLLPEARQAKLYSDLLTDLKELRDESGRIKHFMWLRQVTCVRK